MLDNLKILNIASAMVRHSAERHSVLAENIANANTNGYKAKDLEAFGDAFSRLADRNGEIHDRPTTAGPAIPWRVETIDTPGAASPNGNTVSLEDQMMRSIEAQQNHDAALAIYRKTIDMLRTSLGRGA